MPFVTFHQRKRDFNPRSPHGERPPAMLSARPRAAFQSTLPARGATYRVRADAQTARQFQSTLPARGATAVRGARRVLPGISIHAPRTGSDLIRSAHMYISSYFNPRSPHGERPFTGRPLSMSTTFQSTLPARGATRTPRSGWPPPCNFNPRSPHGERRYRRAWRRRVQAFQSTLPARGATQLS